MTAPAHLFRTIVAWITRLLDAIYARGAYSFSDAIFAYGARVFLCYFCLTYARLVAPIANWLAYRLSCSFAEKRRKWGREAHQTQTIIVKKRIIRSYYSFTSDINEKERGS